VYDCWFPLKVEWPALTFDILEDTKGKRKGFPLATAIVAGTQVLLMCCECVANVLRMCC
jgi:hypothetical protein